MPLLPGQSDPYDGGASYDLEEPELPRPSLPGDVVVRPTEDELIDSLAADLVIHAENCVREFGDFQLALSGGATFENFYARLMYDPNYRRLPWRRTHLWFVVERDVPFDDERSCYRQISEILGDHADIPPEQFHPIFAGSESVDTDYEAELRETLAWREKGQDRLDYVLLTIDGEGATAGLQPRSPVLHEEHRLVVRCRCRAGADRDVVTLTPPVINAARFIAVLVTGSERASAVRRLVDGHESADAMPIKGIAPMRGELKWYLDAPACGGPEDQRGPETKEGLGEGPEPT